MIPLVSHKYRYILFYSPKVACTALRELFLDLHKGELNDSQLAMLNGYHNINEVFVLDSERDYSGYFMLAVTRNPYARLVSAFLDQYVYVQEPGIQHMLDASGVKQAPDNFAEFVQMLQFTDFSDCDCHFAPQSYVASEVEQGFLAKLDMCFDAALLKPSLATAYRSIFSDDQAKLAQSLALIDGLERRNRLYYSGQKFDRADSLPLGQLDAMVSAPAPQYFLRSSSLRRRIRQYYRQDFKLFNYAARDIPSTGKSTELSEIPKDFDWQTYLYLNPDLENMGIKTERAVIRHYLEFGRFESAMRAFKLTLPMGFDWQKYLHKNSDLLHVGINNERLAIVHYLDSGAREGRKY